MQSRFLKVSVLGFVIALLALSMTQIGLIRAAAPAQATDEPSSDVLFGPCPPEGSTATEAAPSGGTIAGSAGAAAATPGAPGPRAFLGVQVAPVDDCGGEVVGVLRNGPADQAGITVGDIIVAVDCVPLSLFDEPLGPVDNTMMATPAVGNAPLNDCSATADMGVMATADASGTTGSGTLNPIAAQCLTSLGVLPASTTGTVATPAANADDLSAVDFLVCMVQSHKPNDVVLFTVERGDQELNLSVTLGATLPATAAATQAASTGNTGGSTGGTATPAATSAATAGATAAPTGAATGVATTAPTMEGTVSVPGDATAPAAVPTMAATP